MSGFAYLTELHTHEM